jgi:hypothetical protein
VSRARLNVFLEHDHAARVDELATMKRMSKSAVIAAALAAYLSPESADRRDAATAKRLEGFARRLERLERDQIVLIETLALFIRHHLSVTSPIAEAHQDAARAQGRVRFQQFIEQLARHLRRGDRLVRGVFDEVTPPEPEADRARSNGRTASAEVLP